MEKKRRLGVQSYCNSVERFAGCKDTQFTLPSNILKSPAKHREDFYCKYLKQSNNHNVGCLPSNIVQHWVDTSYLTIQPWEDSSDKSDCRMSTTETQFLENFILSSSKEGNISKSSERKKDSNKNVLTATSKKKIIDIGEGANHHDTNNKNTEMSNDKSENIMLDNDDEKSINNNNMLNHKNKENETIRQRSENLRIQKDGEEVSMLEDNTTKVSHCKKLYNGSRDSPVALVHETYNNRSSMFELTSHLRPGLNGSKMTKVYKMNKKKRIPQWSILSENINDSIFSSLRTHERRKTEQSSKLKNIFLSSPASRNFPASIANNMIKKQSATKSTNGQSMNISLHEKEGEHDNLTRLKETLNDEQQRKILNNEKEELKTVSPENHFYSPITTVELNETVMSHGSLNPVTCLQQQCNIQKISNQNKTEACLRNTNAVMRLERLSESDIQKYKKLNKRKMHNRALNPVVCLERLSESDIKKYKKSNKREMHHRDLNPVVSLELPPESDIQKHETVETTQARTDASVIFIPEDVDSDQSTVIIVECQSRRYSKNNDSDSTVIDQSLPARSR